MKVNDIVQKLLWRAAKASALFMAMVLATPEILVAAEPCQLVNKKTGKTFMMFEVLRYQNKPDLLDQCLKPLKIWYGHEFWPDGTPSRKDFDLSLPQRDLVEEVARLSPSYGPITVFDIEHWPLKDETFAQASVDNYVTVAEWFRKVAPPDQQFGYYGMVPIRDYSRALKGEGHADFQEWQAENDRLAPFAAAVDILFPSIYTFYNDPDDWMIYAKAQIDESRRIASGKPVVAFIWPVYHPSNRLRGGDPLEQDFWQLQLEFLTEHADGLVIWTHSDTKTIDFADIPPWWDVTQQFLKDDFECLACS
jgi:hypothetical protein